MAKRYYFHVLDGEASLDETGYEFESPADVRKEALQTAGAMLTELGPDFWDRRSWTLWVTDEDGGTVLTLDLSAPEPK